MKTSIIHDWLTGMRGGEKVLEALCQMLPQAEIFTLFHFPENVSSLINEMKIHRSPLQRLLVSRSQYRYYLPLFPWAVRHFDLGGSDLILSISHCVAKGVRKPADSLHICYCLTPMRYIWKFYDIYFNHRAGLTPAVASLLRRKLQRWDFETAQQVDHFIAISQNVANRIKSYYKRPAQVIYPPVDTDFFTPAEDKEREDFYLIVSALVPYKRIDLAIQAFNKLGQKLLIAGVGSEQQRLRRMAGANIKFLGFVPDQHLRELYQKARALIFPGEEDFGLVSLEAQACGTPVIGYNGGGLVESVIAGETGVLFFPQSAEALEAAVKSFAEGQFDREKIRQQALRFSLPRFKHEFRSVLEQLINRPIKLSK